MKRKISLLLCALLCFNIFFTGVYMTDVKAEENILTKTEAEALDVLQALDIVSEEFDNQILFDRTKEVTRAEFATYLRKFINQEEQVATKLYYNDVSANHYAYNDITLLTELGYLNGVGEKIFAPEQVMKKEHAYIVFLNILGYNVNVAQSGPVAAANNAGISKSVSASENLTLGDLFVIMYNSLIADCLEMSLTSSKDTAYVEGDTSYLYLSRNMKYYKKGIVTGVHGASIYDEAHKKDQMIIDGVTVELDDKDYFEFLGRRVHYIVHFEDYNDDKTLIWIGAEDAEDSVKLEVEEDSHFDAATYTLNYCKNEDLVKRYNIPTNVTVIYNGSFYSGNVSDIFSMDKYDVTFLSHETKYDIAIVWSYENIIADAPNYDNLTVVDKLTDEVYNIDAEKYEYFSLTLYTGEVADVDDIEENDVISIYVSQCGKYFRGIISRKVVSGDITEKEDNEIKVDGEFYSYHDSSKTINSGAKSATLYLDFKGYIADARFSYSSENRFVAYICEFYNAKKLSETPRVKILTEDGTLETIHFAEMIAFNGTRTLAEDVFDSFTKTAGGKVQPQLVIITKNEAGEVRTINTASDNGGTALVVNGTLEGLDKYRAAACSEQGIIGVSMLYNSDTKVFNVPADEDIRGAEDNKFSVSGVVNNNYYLGAVSYKLTNEDIFYEQYLVHKETVTEVDPEETNKHVRVKKVSTELDKDDEIVTVITIVGEGAEERKYTFDEDCVFSDVHNGSVSDIPTLEDKIAILSPGDIIRVVDHDGALIRVQKVYDHGTTGLFFWGDGGAGTDKGLSSPNLIYGESKTRIFAAYVTDKEGSAFKIETGYTGSDYSQYKNQVLNLKNANALIVIYEDGEFTKGTYNDIKKGDFIVTQTVNNQIFAVTVYKDIAR